jgi:Nuclease-related domain/UvrD-like helicase C-terminal domain
MGDMPICRPEQPRFSSGAERQVWDRLKTQLGPEDVLLAGIRVSDRTKDHEADLVVLMPGGGIVVVEVKGGSVWRARGEWFQARGGGSGKRIDPVEQARGCRYALREYVESDSRWYANRRQRVRWAHAVVLPNCTLPGDFAEPDCPRWMVADRSELSDLAGILREIVQRQDTVLHLLTTDDAAAVLDILAGRGGAQREVIADSDERAVEARRLTQEQADILDAIRLLHRVEVRGGPGSGKTWLALEQGRRLTRAGSRVAVLCYSRGLAAYLRRYVETLPAGERPAYVGEFHSLGHSWGAAIGSNDSEYWENSLPAEMRELAIQLPAEQRFDAVIIDEAQDFADAWWLAVLASLKDEETGGLYAFSDEGQRVFARFGQPPVPLIPIMLDHNLRNTRQIAETFNPLTSIPMRMLGGEGPDVRFVDCTADDAMSAGDDAVDSLLEEGWRPEDIVLLTTGSRHSEQVQRQAVGQSHYWDTFWDTEQVFYGHVLGFKGLERRAVVLVLNEREIGARSRERLYVGLSRARDQLVVCGSADTIRVLGGEDVLRVLKSGTWRREV